MNIELSNHVKERGTMYEWAEKVVGKKELSPDQIIISESMNKWALEIANSGTTNVALSDYLQRVVQEQIYDEPSQLLDTMFNQGSIGEFDDYNSIGTYKNNLLAHEVSERGGSVDKSYVDFSRYSMVHTNLQIETELRYDELRRNGAMTIAQLTLYAIESLQNKKFQSIFTNLNTLLVSGSNVFDATGGLTVQLMDDFAGYVTDHSFTGQQLITGLSTDLRDIKNMPGYTDFLSYTMKDALNMGSGVLSVYNSVPLASISAGKLLADGSTLIPAKTIYGFSDKIGQCDMRGSLRVLQTPDNAKEVIRLKFTGYEFIYAIDKLEKVSKIKVK
jgi:hypothetical protein